MRWGDSRRSDNVEDRRGLGVGRGAGIGLGTLAIVVVGYFMGVNPATLLTLLGASQDQSAPVAAPITGNSPDAQTDFVRAVLGETEDVWSAYFAAHGRQYVDPRLVLFSGSVSSACGFASSASGPFYCSQDQQVYIDLSFFRQLSDEFGAPGDFARAYVIAHEVGHHVQNLLGITERAQREESRADRTDANRVSVRIELQADCLAGVWAHRANAAHRLLEPGDLQQGLQAASSVGDDTLQKRAQGSVVPDSFTHGSSAQRVDWFRRGFDAGEIGACDTFAAGSL